jgi:dTDP-4-amino-4,6-dideoxygalactose transaminase
MLNLQAALGVSQIDRLEDFIAVKRKNFARYREKLSDLRGARLLPFPEDIRANHWFYALLFEDGDLRDCLMNYLIKNGVQCRPVWKLVHTQKAYRSFRAYDMEKAPFYEKHILNIPCSTSLTEEQVDMVSQLIRTYMD